MTKPTAMYCINFFRRYGWALGLAGFVAVVVAGALSIIASRGDVLLFDLATNYQALVWCF